MKSTREKVDDFAYLFPVLIRYVGLITTLVLIGFCLAGFAVQAAPGFVPAGAMILYKSLHDATKSPKKDEEENTENEEESTP